MYHPEFPWEVWWALTLDYGSDNQQGTDFAQPHADEEGLGAVAGDVPLGISCRHNHGGEDILRYILVEVHNGADNAYAQRLACLDHYRAICGVEDSFHRSQEEA